MLRHHASISNTLENVLDNSRFNKTKTLSKRDLLRFSLQTAHHLPFPTPSLIFHLPFPSSISILNRTSWPYFRVKLSCVCLKITYKKKSKDKNTIVIYDKMIYYCKLQNVNIQSTQEQTKLTSLLRTRLFTMMTHIELYHH